MTKIIARITQDNDRCLMGEPVQPALFEIPKRLPVIGSPQPNPEPDSFLKSDEGLFHLAFLEYVTDFNEIGAENKRSDPGHRLVQTVEEKKHKP